MKWFVIVTTLTLMGCGYQAVPVSSPQPSAPEPTPAQQEEAAELRKELPQLDEVRTVIAQSKEEGSELTDEEIDMLLSKFTAAESRLQQIESRLKQIESGHEDHDDHSDHDH